MMRTFGSGIARGIAATVAVAVTGWAVFACGPRDADAERDAAGGEADAGPRKLILIAGKPSHPPLMHEFRAGCLLLAEALQDIPEVEVEVHDGGWVQDAAAFESADAVVIFADGGRGHPALQGERLETLRALIDRGVGFGAMHYGVEVPADKAGAEFKKWIGGYYENQYSVNPIWSPSFDDLPDHPITRGVEPFQIEDEWYFNMRFAGDADGIEAAKLDGADFVPILVATPSDDVRDGPYVYPQGPYDHIVAEGGEPEAMMWAVERPDGGRGFGFTGGHFHLNWGNDDFRRTVLNALVWVTGADVPDGGVESSVTDEQLRENLDAK